MANYVIRSGDTLSALARRFGTTVQALAQANGIANPDMIRAGATLTVPDAPGGGSAAPQQRPAGAPAPTTGAMPRPRPQQATAPIPPPNPTRGPMPIPPPNPMRGLPGNGMAAPVLPVQQGAPLEAPPPDPITPQMASYAAGPMPRSAPGQQGAGGLPNLASLSTEEFGQLRSLLATIPASRENAQIVAAVEDETRRRIEQARNELTRLDQSASMQQNRQNAWMVNGETVRDPMGQPPGEPSIGEGEYLPAEMIALGQLGGNMRNAPRAITMLPTLGLLSGPRRTQPTLGQLANRPMV